MRIVVQDGNPQIMVRIALVEGEERVRFEADGPFTVEDDCHSKKTKGKSGQVWEVRVKGGAPASFAHYVRTDLSTDEEEAQRLLEKQKSQDSSARLLLAGQKLEHNGKVILDNREYWVSVGTYDSEMKAMAWAKLKSGSKKNALAVREMVGVPRGHVEVVGPDGQIQCLGRRVFIQAKDSGQVILHDCPVGREFHWEHREKLSFRGTMEFLVGNDGKLLVVNELSMEDYLASVNSSEMDARCPLEFLKAQTVAARSTVLATAGKHHRLESFDLCNGDHCQCYYGVAPQGPASRRAVEETRGEILVSDGRVCDARYSKVCGGVMEANEHVWPNQPISYMRSGVDAPSPKAAEGFYPIDTEEKARKWIMATPGAYCNPNVSDLPDYLAYARDYFRWQVTYDRHELEELIKRKTGMDMGTLQRLDPKTRGQSGRVTSLTIVGANEETGEGVISILWGELEIRRVLSKSHLYSSCFVVDYEKDSTGHIQKVILRGAGWGHGVGMCQAGATMMAVRGNKYDQILAHYYRGTELKKIFKGQDLG